MTKEDFDKAAKLSHLSFEEGEKESFIKDMTDILAFADTLCEFDVSEHERMKMPKTPLDDDEKSSQSYSELICQSKKSDGTYIIVPCAID